MATALIVCVGNDLVADDGVGHVVFALLSKQQLPPGTRLKLLGLGGMALLEEFGGEDHLVVVDAVQFGTKPGTIHVMDWSKIPSGGSHVSCHGIGIREAIEVSKKLYPEKTPRIVHLVGVEGKCFDKLGEGLTEDVAAAVEPAVAEVLQIIKSTA
jgi:hydrogenase maturation protease